MTATPPENVPAPARWVPLEPAQRRVLGVLIEKAKTTPAGYPMSVNAIVAACNQKNNRDPLTAYDDTDVENTLRDLEKLGVVSEVDWMGRVPKYKHHAYEWMGVSKVELAVMAELLLRGAQALGELRARAARMEPIADLTGLKPVVEGLLERRLMIELTPPGRGQIVSHNLYRPQELAEVRAAAGGRVRIEGQAGDVRGAETRPGGETREWAGAPVVADAPARLAEGTGPTHLAQEVAELRAEIGRLRERIERLEGGSSGA